MQSSNTTEKIIATLVSAINTFSQSMYISTDLSMDLCTVDINNVHGYAKTMMMMKVASLLTQYWCMHR